MKKALPIFICIILFILLFVVFCMFYFRATEIFQRKMDFALPKSTKIINSKYSYFDEENFYIKVFFNEIDFEYIENNLDNYFIGAVINDPNLQLPAFHQSCSWWQVNEDEIIASYYTMTFGKRAKTREVYAFITKCNDGEYFMYLKH